MGDSHIWPPSRPTISVPTANLIATKTIDSLSNSIVGHNNPGVFLRVQANSSAAGVAGWLMVFDANDVPANGNAPFYSAPIAAGVAGAANIDLTDIGGKKCSQGWVAVVSTSQLTLTVGALQYTFYMFGYT